MMYDIERIEDACGGWGFREVGVVQGSVFFRSQDWRVPVADGIAGLQLFSFLSARGWSPHALLLLLASPPCAI